MTAVVTPFLDDPDLTLYVGDALAVLCALPDESVDCCMTSPPYYGLRDYGVDGQIGLEATPEVYVERLVEVFREVRRVLRPAGTCWVNLGDSYNAYNANRGPSSSISDGTNGRAHPEHGRGLTVPTAKPKDLLGIPWRVALALQADGWWLRSDVIWAKPNPMPESVRDRPTRSHEYLFLLTKAPRYFWDAEAVREPITTDRAPSRKAKASGVGHVELRPNGTPYDGEGSHRNVRSVWTIATQPYPESHFATFPEALVERALAAGCPERVCATCGVPSERVVERVDTGQRQKMADGWATHEGGHGSFHRNGREKGEGGIPVMANVTIGWTDCGHDDWRPGVVLDPFMGSGTVAAVARRMGRRAVGIELNPEYAALIAKRTRQLSLLGGAS